MRYRLRTLMIVLAVALGSIIGAFVGEEASSVSTWGSSPDNAWFAFGWGTTIGVIASVGTAALLADSEKQPSIAWWVIGAITITVFSGASLYVFVVSTAAV